MSISYRTPGAWGAGLSRDLHPGEVDQNFYELKGFVDSILADMPGTTVSIADITQTGDDLYVHLTDGAILGPFKMPVVKLVYRYEWQPATDYFVSDIITNNNSTYMVLVAHTSLATFDPAANDGAAHSYYGLMFTSPANVMPPGGFAGQVLTKLTNDVDYETKWASSGVPMGGAVNTILAKRTGTDYDTVWVAPVGGVPAGGAVDATLTKLSNTNYDVDWIVRGKTISMTGTTHTLVLGDYYGWLRCTNGSGCTITIPDNATVAFAVDTEVTIRSATAGVVAISAAAGVTLNIPVGFTSVLLGNGATALVKKVDTNTWDLAGLLTPS